MKVYIFGAGASLGSQEAEPFEPSLQAPLVDNIFDTQYEKYADAIYLDKAVLRDIKSRIGTNSLEEWLTKEWERVGAPHGKEALAAGRKRFGDLTLYIWWLMVNISKTYSYANGYHVFLKKLEEIDDKEEVAFVNFNYDILLDKALVKMYGYDLSSTITNYTTHNYLKPHGSVNWFVEKRVTDPSISSQDQINQKEILFNRIAAQMFRGEPIDKRMRILDPLNTNLYQLSSFFRDTFSSGKYGYPLLMLPLSAKMNDLINGFMDTMAVEAARIFSQATNIYLIGYRANDEMFNSMIKSSRKGTKLHVVGRDSASDVQANVLKQEAKLTAGDVYSNGFYEFIKELK